MVKKVLRSAQKFSEPFPFSLPLSPLCKRYQKMGTDPSLRAFWASKSRERKMHANFLCTKLLEHPQNIPAKFPGHPRFLPSKPKEDKLSREGTNFSTPTPSGGRPPPQPAVSGPKKVNLCALFSCLQECLFEAPRRKLQGSNGSRKKTRGSWRLGALV